MGLLGGLLLVLAIDVAGAPDDIVRLRSGKVLSGSIQLDASPQEGFLLRPWDREGTLFIRWSQLTAVEIDRILNRATPVPAQSDRIEGIEVFTTTRTVVGVLLKEEPDRLLIKTSAGRTAVAVPKSAVLARHDRILIPETDAYSPEERIERRMARLDPADFAGTTALAGMASRLGFYEKAKELYLRAAAIEPARSDEIDSLVGANEALAHERRAAAVLGEIGALTRKAEYPRAIALARSLLSDWADTEVARQNKDLPAALEKEARDWTLHKADILARRVPEAFRLKLADRVSQAARLSRFSEARAAASRFEAEIVKELADDFKSTADEIRTAWGRRERRARTAAFGSGSWIILGGQEGGLDSDAQFIPVHRNTAKPPPPPIPLGLKLDTAEEWWMKVSRYERMDWVEAEFARTTAGIVKTTRERRCSRCVGEGELSVSRRGIDCRAKCSRCHGSKVDQSMEYQ